MEDKKILSVIIPTYNMEAYLPQCLDSLVIPSIEKLDIIVVNDGSKDKSSEIAHTYSEKFPGVVRVLDKENGNYGSCINAALPAVKGKYVKILDADDSFDTQNLEKFINILEECDADLIISDYYKVDQSGKIISLISDSTIPSFQKINTEVLDKIIKGGLGAMHAYTYKTSIFNGIEYHQTEGISYTDNEWIFYPVLNCNTIFYVNIPVYKYLIGRDGQTMDREIFIKRLDNLFPIIEKMTDFYSLNINNFDNFKKNFFDFKYYGLLGLVYQTILFYDTDFYTDFLKFDSNLQKDPAIYSELQNRISKYKGYFYPIKYWNKKNKNRNALLLKLLRTFTKLRN